MLTVRHQTRFPVIEHIDDVMPAVTARQGFVVIERGPYKVVDYVFKDEETFGSLLSPDPEQVRLSLLARELRGLKFDTATGRLIARAYHKFFNLGELPETQPGAIDWGRPYVNLVKLDGSMIHPALVEGRVLLMTRKGWTEVARQPEAFVAARTERRYGDLFRSEIDAGRTPIFEWCSLENRIVVAYVEPNLILTGSRDIRTGDYLDHDALVALGRAFNVPVVETYPFDLTDIEVFRAHVRQLAGMEGTITRFADGDMLKLKADAYVSMHRAKDQITVEKNLVKIILDQAEDDLLPLLPESDREPLLAFRHAMVGGMTRTAERLAAAAAFGFESVGRDRKRFAMEVAPGFEGGERNLVFQILDGREPLEVVSKEIAKNVGSGPKLERVRPLFGGIHWKDFFKAVDLEG